MSVSGMSTDQMSADGPVRVVIVDDDALVRAGLAMILGGDDGIEVIGQAGDGQEGVALAQRVNAQVVLMDIRMPVLDGLAATKRLMAQPGPPKVIVLTTFDGDDYVVRALRDGASGFLLKDTPPAEIVAAVHKVAAGEHMLSPRVTAQLIARLGEGGPVDHRASEAKRLLATLSEREREVAVAVGQGMANAQIAADLYMSVATVKAHVSRILDKLGVDNRVQVAICVHDAGAA
jgi:DNA-binding NarL/FixJ family response regulator